MTLNPAMMSSANPNWQTPPEVLDVVRQMGPIILDPCTTVDNPVGAKSFFTRSGLTLPWATDGGLIFVNPPYGDALPAWAKKIADEGARGGEIIALVPSRTDTRWWHMLTRADAICFWQGRIKFVGAKHGAPFPSAVIYFGHRAMTFGHIFNTHGWIVRGLFA